MSNRAPRAGDRVGPPDDPDQYVLMERLGNPGGEGEVWLAHRAEREVGPRLQFAIKLLTPGPGWNANDLGERWMNSARFLHGLDIAGLCQVFGGFEGAAPHPAGERSRASTWYLVMEWVSGRNYDRYLEHHPGVIMPLANVAAALDELHAAGWAHGDVKPANIKITHDEGRFPESKLVDVSLIRQVTGKPTEWIAGTPGYADPSLRERRMYTPLSDLYGFAATLCFALANVSPSDGIEASIAALRAAADGPAVERIVGALDPDPDRRAERAGYEEGNLQGWLREIVFDVDVVSEQQRKDLLLTLPMPEHVEEVPQEPGFMDQVAAALLDTPTFRLFAAAAILAGFIIGLIVGS
jgi:serine/threonine protein kinase